MAGGSEGEAGTVPFFRIAASIPRNGPERSMNSSRPRVMVGAPGTREGEGAADLDSPIAEGVGDGGGAAARAAARRRSCWTSWFIREKSSVASSMVICRRVRRCIR